MAPLFPVASVNNMAASTRPKDAYTGDTKDHCRHGSVKLQLTVAIPNRPQQQQNLNYHYLREN